MSGPFKMKGWSPFTQKTHPQHPVTPPAKEESEKSSTEVAYGKGELFERDLTGFRRYDRVGTKAEQKARRSKSQNLFYENGKIIWRKIEK